MITQPQLGPEPYVERYGIGGSQAAAAIGLSQWQAPITVWQELQGQLVAFEGNEFSHWGKMLEASIRQEYANRHGVEVEVLPEPIYDVDRAWMRASPDGLVLIDGEWQRGLEAKNVGSRMADYWGEEGSEEVPVPYEIQCRWYMAITKLPRWDPAVLIGGQEYREYVIERDLDIEEAIVGDCEDFWHNHVLTGIPPEPDATNDYSKYLVSRFKEKRDVYLQASVTLDEKVRELVALREVIKRAKEESELLTNQIRYEIGDAAGVDTSLGRLKNVLVSGKTQIGWQAIAEEAIAQAQLRGAPIDRDELIARHTSKGDPYHRFYGPREAKRKRKK